MPLTDAGFEAYDIETLRAMLQGTYESESGETPDWDEDTFLGSFSEAVLYVLRLQSLGIQQLWDAQHIDGASGRALEARAAEHLVYREEATASRAVVTLGGTSGVVVPAGKIVECSANKTRWVLLEDTEIPSSTAIVECETKGPVPGPAATITNIVTPVSGWTSVTNASAATLGNPREGDGAFRGRIIRSGSYLAGRTAPALVSAVEALSFITSALVVNNTTPSDTTVGAFTVPAHGHLLLVEPSTLTTAEKETLAQTIFDTIGYGTQQGGAQTASVIYRGKAYPEYWDHATDTEVTVAGTLTLKPGYLYSDVEAAVEAAIQVYFGGLSIGDPVLLLGVYGAIASVPGVKSATVTLEGSAADYAVAETAVAVYADDSAFTEA